MMMLAVAFSSSVLIVLSSIGNVSIKFDPNKYLNQFLSHRNQNDEKVNLLLLCHYRGGSSFLFELLSGHPLTTRLFEPLHTGHANYSDKIDLLHSIYSCRKYPDFNFQHYFFKNTMLHRFKYDYASKVIDSIMEKWVCDNSHVNLVKTIRLRLADTLELLKRPIPGRPLKIIYLVRDPRGMHESRLPILNELTMESAHASCDWIREDLIVYKEIKEKYKDQIMLIRYEDLATKPRIVFDSLLKFTKIDSKYFTENRMKRFMKNSDEESNMKRYGTRKLSKFVYKNWVKTISMENTDEIQSYCVDVLKKLGYKLLYKHTNKNSFIPITHLRIE